MDDLDRFPGEVGDEGDPVALAKGRTNTELAAELGISINTVKFHLRNLYDKMDFKNRAQAIAFYYASDK
jgi:two-component system nitrate/nitrite response regulator NarP